MRVNFFVMMTQVLESLAMAITSYRYQAEMLVKDYLLANTFLQCISVLAGILMCKMGSFYRRRGAPDPEGSYRAQTNLRKACLDPVGPWPAQAHLLGPSGVALTPAASSQPRWSPTGLTGPQWGLFRPAGTQWASGFDQAPKGPSSTCWDSSGFILNPAGSHQAYDLTHLASSYCVKGYTSLTKIQRIEWNNRGMSSVHAFYITTMSLYLVCFSSMFSDDGPGGLVVFRSSPLSIFTLGVSVGYFITDLAMIFWLYPSLGGMEYVIHHLLSVFGISYAMYSGEGQLYTFLVLISETTTPGINLRWFLDTAGMKRSKAYLINGVLMFFAWVVSQTAPSPKLPEYYCLFTCFIMSTIIMIR
ncbi:hypothetical protein Taro_042950 [Colocasia esculenta]|uniref:TLC domain-containing protein n=1 Tax=Colocasia esculenta TaxID=4460 RepID=A0A843WXT6_COLES|nr:hypothetical protein [Colocasia esculenta]